MLLSQKLGMLGGRLKISLGDDDVLVVSHRKYMNTNESKYLLDHIDPRYDTFKQFSLAASVLSGVSLVASGFLWWYGKEYYQPPDDVGFLFMSIVFFVVFVVAGIKAVKSRVNVICFNTPDGRRLFNIFGDKPSVEEVRIFSDALAKRIEQIRYGGGLSNERMSEILEKHVEFLCEHDVLSPAEKEVAIDRINRKAKLSVVKLNKTENK